jgi:hypothetical protein
VDAIILAHFVETGWEPVLKVARLIDMSTAAAELPNRKY